MTIIAFPATGDAPSEAELAQAQHFLELANAAEPNTLLAKAVPGLLLLLGGARVGSREDLSRFWGVAFACGDQAWEVYASLVECEPEPPGPGTRKPERRQVAA